MARHTLVLLMTLCSAATFAHEPVNQGNRAAQQAAKAKAGRHSPPDAPSMRKSRLASSEPINAHADRFCMKNYLGKVHCIPMPNHTH